MPDPETGNVDIYYTVEEKPADQVELQGGWGNGMFVGSFGVSFSNFSTRGIKDKTTWSPLPTGDGQKLRLRAQSNGSYYQNYSVSLKNHGSVERSQILFLSPFGNQSNHSLRVQKWKF